MPLPLTRVAILGSTGSIGTQTLQVIDHLNSLAGSTRFAVHALAANEKVEALAAQARQYGVKAVACAPVKSAQLEEELTGTGIRVLPAPDGLSAIAADPAVDLVVLAIYGLDALAPLLGAVEAGKRVALASKEALVAAGSFVMEAARLRGATILPVDSEHSALLQCLEGHPRESVRRVVLTASGGPFRGKQAAELAAVTPEQALNHPVWDMGGAITLNSATLFNKGLEVIEAHYLFGLSAEKIDVVVHPQSIVHAMVELVDGSVVMHAGTPDMRLPIQYALSHPQREPSLCPPLDLLASSPLTFEPVDDAAFPALAACRHALTGPWWMPAALLSANDVLAAAFLAGKAPFPLIGSTLSSMSLNPGAVLAGTTLEPELMSVFRAGQLGSAYARAALEIAGTPH